MNSLTHVEGEGVLDGLSYMQDTPLSTPASISQSLNLIISQDNSIPICKSFFRVCLLIVSEIMAKGFINA